MYIPLDAVTNTFAVRNAEGGRVRQTNVKAW